MTSGRTKTPFARGYVAGAASKVRAAPAELNAEQQKAWLKGYDDANQSVVRDPRKGPRPSMTR